MKDFEDIPVNCGLRPDAILATVTDLHTLQDRGPNAATQNPTGSQAETGIPLEVNPEHIPNPLQTIIGAILK